jgi:beta-N-acetylhexosaminidase
MARYIFLFLILLMAYATWPDPLFFVESEESIDRFVEEMDRKQLLGQVFFLGYVGTTPSKSILEWIEERNLGGINIFTRNADTLKQLAESIKIMQELALGSNYQIPLLIATDQEGGWVRHIMQCSENPGNMALGSASIPEDAFWTGYYIGMELRALGINMNFAPAVDVYYEETTPGIGPRSFSSDPILAGLLAVAYFQGMEAAGVISTAKHYPGHGGAEEDSHGFLPVVNLSFEELWNKDLVPYRFLIKEGLLAIMCGHLAFPQIVDVTEPSTINSFFANDVLRDMMEFEGILITDDMEMYGVAGNNMDIGETCKRALEAGNDMIMISHTIFLQEKCWDSLYRFVQEDDDFYQRVKEAVKRILKVKLKLVENNFPLIPDSNIVSEIIPDSEAEEFFFNSSCRAVTVIRNNDIPYEPEPGEKILLVSQVNRFLQEGKLKYPEADTCYFSFAPMEWSSQADRDLVRNMASMYDTIIFCLLNWNSFEVLNELKNFKGRVIVLSGLTPVYLNWLPWIDSAIAFYGVNRDSIKAAFAVLAGDFEYEGSIPIEIK